MMSSFAPIRVKRFKIASSFWFCSHGAQKTVTSLWSSRVKVSVAKWLALKHTCQTRVYGKASVCATVLPFKQMETRSINDSVATGDTMQLVSKTM